MSKDLQDVFYTDSLVASKTKRGAVEIRFNGMKIQLDTATARKIASDILDTAANADVDAAIFAFGTENIGKGDENVGAQLVDQVRQHRIKLQGEN